MPICNNPLILVTGGARSGKSRFAEDYAGSFGKRVVYIATAQNSDEEMQERIRLHRSRRPSDFITREEPFYPHRVLEQEKTENKLFLLDCLTILLSNHLLRGGEGEDYAIYEQRSKDTLDYVGQLAAGIREACAPFVVVTNEVGMGLVPGNILGRVFRDLAGRANQLLAAEAGEVWFLVSGIPQRIK